jgi:rod shape-determining protein MreC
VNELLGKYKDLVGISLLLVLPLALLFYSGRDREKLALANRVLHTVPVPIEYVADGVFSSLSEVWSGYVALVGVEADNGTLRAQVSELSAELLRLKHIEIENRRLRGLCEFKAGSPKRHMVAARVIGWNLSPYYRVMKIVIDQDDEASVEAGMPVLTHQGLVGRIERASAGMAEVMLIVDPRSRLNVKIAEKGLSGTLVGRGQRDHFTARLLHMEKGSDVARMDTVVTSGFDGVFPPNIEVGYVASESGSQTGVFYEIQVQPAVDFARLEEVLILTGAPPPAGEEEG